MDESSRNSKNSEPQDDTSSSDVKITIDTVDGRRYDQYAHEPEHQVDQKFLRRKLRWENLAIATGILQCAMGILGSLLIGLVVLLIVAVEVVLTLLNIVVVTTYLIKIKPSGVGLLFSLISYGVSGVIIMAIILVAVS